MSERVANPASSDVLDVAIVGGGVSGAYCAWRLKEAMPGSKIALFEGSDRIGGRLLSLTPPNAPHLRAEMGGMDYFSNQTLVRSLVENKLALPHEVVPLSSTSLQPSPQNLLYLRGSRLRFEDLSDPTKIPYRLDPAEQGKSALDLVSAALQQLFPELATLTGDKIEPFLQQAQFQGLPLWQWGFWNLVSRALSEEAYSYIRDSLGYESTLMNYNAVDSMIQFLNIGPNPTMNKVTGGYDEIPLTLSKNFYAAGGQIKLRYRLKSVDMVKSAGGDAVELGFAANSAGWGPAATGDPVTVHAKKVILAMPQRALELLDQTGPIFGGDRTSGFLQAMLSSVTAIPMFKAYLCYPQPWWESLGFVAGKAVTDMPLRQCYYWGVEGDQVGADKTNRNSLLMASYSDMSNEPYWGPLSSMDAPVRHLKLSNPNSPPNLAPADWSDYHAGLTSQLVAELQRQLQRIHGLTPPAPYEAAYIDWGVDPFGGARHVWNVHVKSWEAIPAIAHPIATLPIFICGEAYSATQGNVEGALETAELVMQKCFDLASPGWITASSMSAEA